MRRQVDKIAHRVESGPRNAMASPSAAHGPTAHVLPRSEMNLDRAEYLPRSPGFRTTELGMLVWPTAYETAALMLS